MDSNDVIGNLVQIDDGMGLPGQLGFDNGTTLAIPDFDGENEPSTLVVANDPNNAMARLILDRLKVAADHRRNIGIDAEIFNARRMRDGEFTTDELNLLDGPQSAVWYPLTDGICRTLIAFMKNVLGGNDGRVWDLESTPVPEIPDSLKQRAAEEVAAAVLSSDGVVLRDPAVLLEQVELLKEHLQQAFKTVLERRNDNMKDLIDDQLKQSGFQEVLFGFVDDLVTYPGAIIRGLDVVVKPEMVWKGDTLRQEDRKQFEQVLVRPHNFYPSPDSSTVDDGSYVIEVFNITRSELKAAKYLKGFIAGAVQNTLDHFKFYSNQWLSDSCEVQHDYLDGIDTGEFDAGAPVRAIRYFGKLTGRELAENTITEDLLGNPLELDRDYECEVWVVAEFTIRIRLNNRALHKRPYYMSALHHRSGTFWGRGVPKIIEALQRIANSTLRALIRNMGWTSAPIFEMDEARFGIGGSAPSSLVPGQVVKTNSSAVMNASGDAVRVHQLRSFANHYLTTLAGIVDNAEYVAGVPKFLSGQSVGGGPSRTLGGLLTIQGNATVNIAGSILNIDNRVIQPLIEAMYHYNLVNGDESTQGDAKVVALGATVQLTRELRKDRLGEVLNVMFPFIQGQLVDPSGALVLLRQFIKQTGLNPDDVVPDPESVISRQEEIRNALGNSGGISGINTQGGQ